MVKTTLLVVSLLGLVGCSSAESEEARRLAAERAAQEAHIKYLNSPAGQAETYKKLSERTKNLHRDQQNMRIP